MQANTYVKPTQKRLKTSQALAYNYIVGLDFFLTEVNSLVLHYFLMEKLSGCLLGVILF